MCFAVVWQTSVCVCVCVCTHVCVSSPTAGFRVTIQHPPLHLHPVPFAACVACLIPSPSSSSISLLCSAPPLSPHHRYSASSLHVCVWGGATRGDDGAKNQPLVSLKQQCVDADDAKSNANWISIARKHTKAIWDSKKRDVHKTHEDHFFYRAEK